jgi:hypothetical protein
MKIRSSTPNEKDPLEEAYGKKHKTHDALDLRSNSVSLNMRSSLNMPTTTLGKDRIRVQDGKILIKQERIE